MGKIAKPSGIAEGDDLEIDIDIDDIGSLDDFEEKPVIGIAKQQAQNNQSLADENKELKEKVDQLVKDAEAFVKDSSQVQKIDPKEIDPNSLFYNRRPGFFHTEEYFKVKESIARIGHLIEPVILRPHPDRASGYKYQKVVGDTRVHGCIDNDMMVDAIVRDYTDQEVAILMISENNDRNDRSDIEKGRTYEDLKTRKIFKTQVEIAKNCGISEGSVSDCLKMLTIPEEVVSAFENEASLTTSNARDLLRSAKKTENRQKYERLAEHLFDIGLTDAELLVLFNDLELLERFVKYKTHEDIKATDRLKELRSVMERERIEKEIQSALAAKEREDQAAKDEAEHKKRMAKLQKGPLPANTRRDITVRGKKLGDFVKAKGLALKFTTDHEELVKFIYEDFNFIYDRFIQRQAERIEEEQSEMGSITSENANTSLTETEVAKA